MCERVGESARERERGDTERSEGESLEIHSGERDTRERAREKGGSERDGRTGERGEERDRRESGRKSVKRQR